MEASRCAYKRNIILNSVRRHDHFINQGNYKAKTTCFDYRLVIFRPIFVNLVTRCYEQFGILKLFHDTVIYHFFNKTRICHRRVKQNLRKVIFKGMCILYQFWASAVTREEKGIFTTLLLAPSSILLPAGLHLCFVLQTLLEPS